MKTWKILMFMGDLTSLRASFNAHFTQSRNNTTKGSLMLIYFKEACVVSVFILKKRRKFSASDSFISARIVWYAPFAGRSRSQSFTHTDFLLRFFFLFDIIKFELAKIMQQITVNSSCMFSSVLIHVNVF